MKLNPDTQVVATLGSKEGFANLAQAITAPGDVILVPNPTYPIHAFGFIMAGGVIRHLPARTDSQFMTSLEQGGAATRCRSLRRWCSTIRPIPTAVVADLDFYKEVVGFAKKHDLIVLSDLAYAEIYFEGEPPPSILQVHGAMDIAVEFTTLSKTYAMPGWRMGFAVGNERLIARAGAREVLSRLWRLHADPGGCRRGANGPQDCVDEIRAIYKRRRDCWSMRLTSAGWPIPSPAASMFAWAPIPEMFAASRLSSNSPSCCWSRRRSRCRPASASANMAKAMSASRWSRTSSASARPRATFGRFLAELGQDHAQRDSALPLRRIGRSDPQ